MGGGQGLGVFKGTLGSNVSQGGGIIGLQESEDLNIAYGLLIKKIDAETAISIGGTKFKVTLVGGESLTLKTNSFVFIKDALPGLYEIREIEAPPGYIIDQATYKIELKEGEKKVIEIPNKSKYTQQTIGV
jgi:uncharacterized surface anchored protein